MSSKNSLGELVKTDRPSLEEPAQYNGFDQDVHNQIRTLARTITRSSNPNSEHSLSRTLTNMSQVPGVNPIGAVDPKLDPNLEDFESKFWVKNMLKLVYSDPEFYKPSSLGMVYKDMRAYGLANDADYQANFGNFVYKAVSQFLRSQNKAYKEQNAFDILKPMDGILRPGELTVVLGRPGAGCSTFLKTIASQTYGFHVDKKSVLSYDGLTPQQIKKHFRGDVVYCAESEFHFPHLSVGDTLKFAAKLRTPENRIPGVSREEYAQHMTDVAMATFGLSHTRNTKVGNDYVRGVSGGERKRVSIAEVYLSQSQIQCWDNSTRGLDSATALEFIKALKTLAIVAKSTPLVAIYQCSQDAYDLFDNVVLLYDGYQIYHGDAKTAKEYFLNMGYECPQRQTTADFLTSLTNPAERIVKPGYESKVPRSPVEFYNYWQNSPERMRLLEEIDAKLNDRSLSKVEEFEAYHRARQAKRSRPQLSYTVSFGMQVKYVMERNILRMKGDPSVTLFTIIGNTVISVVTSTMFLSLKANTAELYLRTSALFFAVLFNSFSSLLEIFSLYEARPIVEKHKTYALYHPAADAFASVITELPTKIIVAIAFNLILYFVVHLRRSAGHFFFYLFMNFTITLAMSHMFRCVGAATKSLSQAMTPAALLLLMLIIFTGFVIPPNKMHGWCRWINYIDPVAYAFEALIANEFHDRRFRCSVFAPSGDGYPTSGDNIICSTIGSVAGQAFVEGDDYIRLSFQYRNSHKWRNWAIVFAFVIFFFFVYIALVELNKGAMQKGEVLVFQHSSLRKIKQQRDIEAGEPEKIREEVMSSSEDSVEGNKLPTSSDIFHWRNLRYQVKIKSENRVILDGIDGWVKPGQVTALMGASGAGKTTLLNALSERLTSGVITDGVRMVNGRSLDSSFQRSIGYVQQQDLHLSTSTVREALLFSALLRQPAATPRQEKEDYVDYVIKLLEMERYADAVVGVAGEGLNVEQRKRLTIGVELVAKPRLLLFLDEPTSGLDSQTAWSICKLIRKLADHGQAILCTIHQPLAILMKEFDRLLFLQKGGKVVYFGDLGENLKTLIDYFELYGAPKCPTEANPAEWMLEVIGAAPGSKANQDYHQVWLDSKEYGEVNAELDRMEQELPKIPQSDDPERFKSYATSQFYQYTLVLKRVFEQYWRTPLYTYSKVLMSITASMFNGFTFYKADRTQQGLQNQMFSVFMFLNVLNTLIQQYLPLFVSQRLLYEVRERPSKTFSWFAFICAQITAEVPWNFACGTLAFFVWYYPIGFYRNAAFTDHVNQRGATVWFAVTMFFVYSSTLGQMCISFMDLADNAANCASLLFTACLLFCGVLVPYTKLPKFWRFMYRCNPFTYLVGAVLSTSLADSPVQCLKTELLKIKPPSGQTCGTYMANYIAEKGGYLIDLGATSLCEFCTTNTTNTFLTQVGALYNQRWRNIGFFMAFIVFDMVCTVLFYWLARIPKGTRQK